jgi:hypothetical protein
MSAMMTIHARVEVAANRTVTVPVPDDVAPGEWDAVLVLGPTTADEDRRRAALRELRSLPPLQAAGWPSDLRYRREDLYDDELPA